MDLDFDPREPLLAALGGGSFADLFFEHSNTTSLLVEDDRVERVVAGVDAGVGIRSIHDFNTAYGYLSELKKDRVTEVARGVALRAGEGETRDLALSAAPSSPAGIIDSPPGGVPLQDKVELALAVNRAVRKLDSRVRQVRVIYRDSEQKVKIVNSQGLAADDFRVQVMFAVEVVAAQGQVVQTGLEAAGGFAGFEFFQEGRAEETGLTAARRALKMLEARPAPAGTMCVVLTSAAGGTMIHEAVGHGLEADLAEEGLSVYADRVGRKVASDLVTVVDDGTMPGHRGSFGVDDEGVPAGRNVLVEKGVLKGFMYDRLTAMKHGGAPTGNGRRQSFRHRPICRMTNTLILPGRTDPEEIVSSTGKGLMVSKMGGGQVNTKNGDFVFEVSEGYLIEGGEVVEPVRGATITGNGPRVLETIDMVGSDLGFTVGTCGKDGQAAPVSDGQPTLRIPEVVVGGEAS